MGSQRTNDEQGSASGRLEPKRASLDGRWVVAIVLVLSLLGLAWMRAITAQPTKGAGASDDDFETVAQPPATTRELAPAPEVVAELVIPAGREDAIKRWVEAEDGGPLSLPWQASVGSISIRSDEVEFGVVRTLGGELRHIGSVTVHHRLMAPEAAVEGKQLSTVSDVASDIDDAPRARQAVDALAAHLRRVEPGDVFILAQPPPPAPSFLAVRVGIEVQAQVWAPTDPVRVRMHTRLAQQVLVMCALTAALAMLALAVTLARRRPVTILLVGKITHLLPALLQLLIFTYWSLHWPPARHLALLILPQIVVAYFVEISLSAVTRQSWAASFGNLPVVLSTNLLAQFVGATLWVSLVSVSLAVAAKVFIRRENGKPVFNPSAFGLTIMGLVQILVPGVEGGDFAHEFSTPPNMAELVFLLALIVQFRLKLTLLTLSAALAMVLGQTIFHTPGFHVAWPPFLLVICLLITDPSTIPKTPGGRIVYALVIVAGMLGLQGLFFGLGMSDFWAKVMAIPLANLLAPRFDEWGSQINRLEWLSPRYNKVHMVVWSLVFLTMNADKGSNPEEVRAPLSPCWRGDGSDVCEQNPMFCTPFSVRREAECWLSAGEFAGDGGSQDRVPGEG